MESRDYMHLYAVCLHISRSLYRDYTSRGSTSTSTSTLFMSRKGLIVSDIQKEFAAFVASVRSAIKHFLLAETWERGGGWRGADNLGERGRGGGWGGQNTRDGIKNSTCHLWCYISWVRDNSITRRNWKTTLRQDMLQQESDRGNEADVECIYQCHYSSQG